MAYPSWLTASSLGTVASGSSTTFTVEADNASTISVLSSSSVGTVTTGLDTATISVTAPSLISSTSYAFVLRAANNDGITDRTFTVTVSAIPNISWTQSSTLSDWVIGAKRTFDLTASWDQSLEYVLVSGTLPDGVFLDPTGKIYGIAGANLVADSSTDTSNWIITGNASPTAAGSYTFTVRAQSVSNHKIYLDKTFSLNTVLRVNVDASSTTITVDSTTASVDSETYLSIVLLTPNNLGTYRHSNQFSKQIRAWNPTGEPVNFDILGDSNGYDGPAYDVTSYDGYTASTAEYLQIEQRTGYVLGQLPNIGYQQEDNSFSVAITKVTSSAVAEETVTADFNFKIIGDDPVAYEFIDSNGEVITLGESHKISIYKNQVSDYAVRARQTQNSNAVLFYELVSGSLPPGLTLTATGLISGKVSWNAITTTYSFVVRAYEPSQDQSTLAQWITATQQVQLTVLDPAQTADSYDIYYRAMLSTNQKIAWQNLLTDQRIFNNSIVYRAEDSQFGRRFNCEFLAFPGMSSAAAEEYAAIMSTNWSTKRFYLGALHSSTVTANGVALYDVIYVDIKDPQLNDERKGPPQSIMIHGNEIYPASLEIQLAKLQQDPEQVTDSSLPRWMTCPQADGRPLGAVPAAALCFVQAGQGANVLRKIRTSSHKLTYIDFHVDRLVLKGSPITSAPTTFYTDDPSNVMIFDNDETLFDVGGFEDKYIHFNIDGAIYGINN